MRLHKIVLIFAVVGLSWFTMMALHEFGHVVGAWATGGQVKRVVLHPLTISRTDISPNPNPLVVVWMGPVIGCVLPVLIWACLPKRFRFCRSVLLFLAGFCLIANGAYIGFGALERIGDCSVMLDSGSSLWQLLAFGVVTIPIGLLSWHCLGSVKDFLNDPSKVEPTSAYWMLLALILLLALEFTFSQM